MASRHSRRLQGLGPEHLAYEDRCFICLLEVQSLKRCQATHCCGKFVHKRCFAKAREKSYQFGHCRRVEMPNSDDDTLSLDSESDNLVSRVLSLLRESTLVTAGHVSARF